MEAAFAKLQKEGKTDVDSLVKWIKDSKLIDNTKEQDQKVRSFFNDVQDKKNVSIDKFKEIMKQVADEFKTSLDGISKKLAETGPKMLRSAVASAATTLTGAMQDLIPKK